MPTDETRIAVELPKLAYFGNSKVFADTGNTHSILIGWYRNYEAVALDNPGFRGALTETIIRSALQLPTKPVFPDLSLPAVAAGPGV